MDMQQKRPAMPTRTYSHDALPPKPVSNPIYQSHRVPGTSLQTTIAQHNERPATSVAFTPKSMDIDQSYFAPCVTPESQARQDLWDNALGIDTAVKDNQDLVDFGLGLGPLTTNFTPPSTINEDATLLMPSEYVRPTGLACDTGSPEDGQSWSTLSESSGGLLSDFPDMSPDVANAPAFNADYTTGYDQLMSMNEPTPTATNPMYSRPPSRAFVDASPRHSFRASPYPSQASRSRSFSAGHPALARSHRGSPVPHMSYHRPYASVQASPLSTSNSSIIEGADFDSSNVTMFSQPSLFDDLQTHANLQYQLHEYPTRESSMASSPPKLASSIYDAHSHSHGHSHPPSIASTKCEHHFAGSSVAPDLFGPLSKTPASPPPEDMICESEADIPRSQELRFDGDLYTPKYVRGHGNKREGWCGICSRWLVLKNSAFWYDKSFSHGISAATGSAFEAPRETRRMKSNPDVWEGFCGSCGEWVALISSKKKGTTWFRHAYKCHTHQRVKDTPKRRREMSAAKQARIVPPGTKAAEQSQQQQLPTSIQTSPSNAIDNHHFSSSTQQDPPLTAIKSEHTASEISQPPPTAQNEAPKVEAEGMHLHQSPPLFDFDVPLPSLETDDQFHHQPQHHQQHHDILEHSQPRPQLQAPSPSMTHDLAVSGGNNGGGGAHDFSTAFASHQDFSSVFGTPIATPTFC